MAGRAPGHLSTESTHHDQTDERTSWTLADLPV